MEANREEASKCKRIGKKYLDRDDPRKAVKFLEKAGRMNPKDAETRMLLERAREALNPKRKRKKEEESSNIACNRILANPRDAYAVLGVPRNADEKTIKSAYRKLARKFHPDKNNNSEKFTEAFKAIGQAYDTLADPQKRAHYDRFGTADATGGRDGGAGHAHGFRTADEIFESFFAGGRRPGFRTGRFRRRATENPQQQRWQQLVHLLPLLLVLLASSIGSYYDASVSSSSSSSLYSFSKDLERFPVGRRTSTRDVPFYVGEGVDRDMRSDRYYRRRVDASVEDAYFRRLQRKCDKEKREKRRMIYRAEATSSSELLKRAHEYRLENCEALRSTFGGR